MLSVLMKSLCVEEIYRKENTADEFFLKSNFEVASRNQTLEAIQK